MSGVPGRYGANEMTKYFKQRLSRRCLQQTARLSLSPHQVIVGHFKERAITSSHVGNGETGRWEVMGLSRLSVDTGLCFSRSTSTESHRQLTLSGWGVHLSQGELSGIWWMRKKHISFTWYPVSRQTAILPTQLLCLPFCLRRWFLHMNRRRLQRLELLMLFVYMQFRSHSIANKGLEFFLLKSTLAITDSCWCSGL